MQPANCLRQSFIVTGQTAEAGLPINAPLNHPAPRQQDEALLGGRQFYHFQSDAVCGDSLNSLVARVGLIYLSDFDRLVRDFLHLRAEFRHLCTVLLTGCRHMQGQQMPERVYRQMHFASLRRLPPS